eukprot:TRINITY_DN15602_c0_g1_i1.p1 TRINITY_DN15602_c0_g1~~TRINITY_DN15602_c0_g1_i1.p1  ORF type:complete len:544 (+),score=94.63 TRINITY_DN15602_c0_g1_i1:16-1647(+)
MLSRLCRLGARAFSTSQQTKEYDVIVVGCGLAGVCAALEASNAGKRVLLLDRYYGGGASILSGGVVYAGGGTKQQIQAGVKDTPDNMFQYLKHEVEDAVSTNALRHFCETSASDMQWLEDHGAKFEGSLCPYKTGYPTDSHYLYHSGNELAYPYKTYAAPAARGHRQVATGANSGRVLFTALRDRLLQNPNVEFWPISEVTRLEQDSNGRVIGVCMRTAQPTPWHRILCTMGTQLVSFIPAVGLRCAAAAQTLWDSIAVEKTAHAGGGVILCAGGFVYNRDMVAKHAPAYLTVPPLGTLGDDGSGIALAQTVGGATAQMHRMTAWRMLTPPAAFLEGVSIGRNGTRIANEELYGASFSEAMVHEHQCQGYLIVDANTWQRAKEQTQTQAQWFTQIMLHYVFRMGHKKADSLQELARKINVDADTMMTTLNDYNRRICSNEPDTSLKSPSSCLELTAAPFYAIDISVNAHPVYIAPGLSLGGVTIHDDTGGVTTETGQVVAGLYAAGRTAVGICSNKYLSGLSLADCVFSGRRAGRAAARASRQ